MNPMQHSSISVPQVSHPSGWVSKSSQVPTCISKSYGLEK